MTRWAVVAETNKKVMNLAYSLFPQYNRLFNTPGNNNNEGTMYRECPGPKQGSNTVGLQGLNSIGPAPALNKILRAMQVQTSGSNITYSIVDAARGKRTFNAGRNYILPIPVDALSQNKNMSQNPNYQ